MPYVRHSHRAVLDPYIEALSDRLVAFDHAIPGNLNYIITRLIGRVMQDSPTYATIALLTGVLENAKQEFYRRQATPYEEVKRASNGDILEYEAGE